MTGLGFFNGAMMRCTSSGSPWRRSTGSALTVLTVLTVLAVPGGRAVLPQRAAVADAAPATPCEHRTQNTVRISSRAKTGDSTSAPTVLPSPSNTSRVSSATASDAYPGTLHLEADTVPDLPGQGTGAGTSTRFSRGSRRTSARCPPHGSP